jgi:hypothetical protein
MLQSPSDGIAIWLLTGYTYHRLICPSIVYATKHFHKNLPFYLLTPPDIDHMHGDSQRSVC